MHKGKLSSQPFLAEAGASGAFLKQWKKYAFMHEIDCALVLSSKVGDE